MSSIAFKSLLRIKCFSAISKPNLSARINQTVVCSINSRYFATEQVNEKSNTTQDTNLIDSEKKLVGEIDILKEELATLKSDNDKILDKYKRALAETENLRKRLTKQIEEAKIFGIQSFCKDLLEVADILGHATESVSKDEIPKNPHLKDLFEGLQMTKASLLQVFKRHGVEVVNPVNEKFNPNLHEALFQKVVEGLEPNTVVEVSKLGYKLNERCIRPALVGVSKSL